MKTAPVRSRDERIAAIAEMRERMLSLTLVDLGLTGLPEGRQVLGMLMETGVEDAAYSLVSTADGAVSLYFSNGGGTIGAGEHETVRTAAAEFLDFGEHFLVHAAPASGTPLPEDGQVIFYFVTPRGVLYYSAAEVELGEERDPLTPLFFAAHAVISEVRALDEQRPGDRSDA